MHLQRLSEFRLIHLEKNFLDYPFTDGVYIVTGPRQIGISKDLFKKIDGLLIVPVELFLLLQLPPSHL